MVPSAKASTRAASSTTSPRAVLMRKALRRIRARRSRFMRWRVSGVPGGVGVALGTVVCAAFGPPIHPRDQLAGPALFATLRLHVRPPRPETGLAADCDGLGHSDVRAEVRLGREPIVIREIGPPLH